MRNTYPYPYPYPYPICGTLLQIVPIGLGGAPGPGVAAFPGAFVPSANGQFSNDFFIGEGMFAVAQGFGWGYGYYAPYFLYMEEADPGCGVVELDNVYSRYQHQYCSSQYCNISLQVSRTGFLTSTDVHWTGQGTCSQVLRGGVEEGAGGGRALPAQYRGGD